MPRGGPGELTILLLRGEERGDIFKASIASLHEPVFEVPTLEEARQQLTEKDWSILALAATAQDIPKIISFASQVRHQHRSLPILLLLENELSEEAAETIFAVGQIDYLRAGAPTAAIRAKIDALKRLSSMIQDPTFNDANTSFQQLALLFETAKEYAIFTTDLNGNVSMWNPGAERILGYSEEEIMGKPVALLFTPEDVASDVPRIEMQTARTTGKTSDERWHLKKDGSRFFASGFLFALRTGENKLIGYAKILRDISDKMAALDQLKISHDRLTRAQRFGRIGVWEWNLNTRSASWSEELEALYGLPPGGLSKYTTMGEWLEHMHPEDREPTHQAFLQSIEKKIPLRMQFRLIGHDQSIRWLESRADIEYNDQGQPMRLVGVNIDITELKQLQENRDNLLQKLELEHQELETLLQQMPSGVALAEAPSGKLLLHNDEAVRLLRHPMLSTASYNDYIEYGALHFDGTPYKPEEYPIARAARNGETVKNEEMMYRRGDGTLTYFSVNAAPILNTLGEIVAAVSTFFDIADRKLAETTLRSSEERYRRIFEASIVGNVLTDPSTGKILNTNQRFLEIVGYDSDELQSLTFREIIHPEDRDRNSNEFHQMIRGERPDQRLEQRLIRKNGQLIWVLLMASIIRDAEGAPQETIIIVHDITKRRQAEESIRLWNQELERRVEERTAALVEKSRQLEHFCYTMAHDLRSPLRAIQGFSHLIRMDYGDKLGQDAQDYLNRMSTAAHRMDLLIHDLLQYSRATLIDLKFEHIDLSETTASALADLQDQISASNAHIEIQSTMPKVVAHYDLLHAVLVNLLRNALTFHQPGENPLIRIEAEQRNGMVCVTITDNGIGIAEEFQEKVFGVFERLDYRYPGTGIGLAIVRRSVERMGGKAGLESKAGTGSQFWFELPAANS